MGGGSLFVLIALGIGRLFKYTAPASLLALAVLPLVSWATGQPSALTWACLGMLLITVVKRLEANRLPLRSGAERQRVLVRRLLLDRDVRAREAWVRRVPSGEEESHG